MEILASTWYNTRGDSLASRGGKDSTGMENTY